MTINPWLLRLGLFLTFLSLSAHLSAQDSRFAAWWEEQYKKSDHKKVERAHRVFARILKVADTSDERRPVLLVVKERNDPLAVAIHDGTVVLSEGALDICYRGVDPDLGDARLAFVLAHELAHLAQDDFWHLRAFATSDKKIDAEPRRRLLDTIELSNRDSKKRELEADERGFLTAIMAGYDPVLLLDRSGSFFRKWVEQASGQGAYESETHPGAKERAGFLKGRLRKIAQEDLAYFELGNSFYAMGDFERAIASYQEFAIRFPGRAVFNNLGASHFQAAMRILGQCESRLILKFKLPVLLDPETLALQTRHRGSGDSPCYGNQAFVRHKESARDSFESAIERDSSYPTARLNKLALHILSSEAATAYSAALEIPERKPPDPLTQSLRAIGNFLYSQENRFHPPEGALAEIDEAAKRAPKSADITYNRASLHQQHLNAQESRTHEQAEKVKALWKAYLDLESQGPHADYARERMTGKAVVRDPAPRARPKVRKPPFPLGKLGKKTLQKLKKLSDPLTVVTSRFTGRLYRDKTRKVLVIDASIVLIEVKQTGRKKDKKAIQKKFGPPEAVYPTTSGEFLRYPGLGVLLRNGIGRAFVYFPDRSAQKESAVTSR